MSCSPSVAVSCRQTREGAVTRMVHVPVSWDWLGIEEVMPANETRVKVERSRMNCLSSSRSTTRRSK
jgi:hypothetical protein